MAQFLTLGGRQKAGNTLYWDSGRYYQAEHGVSCNPQCPNHSYLAAHAAILAARTESRSPILGITHVDRPIESNSTIYHNDRWSVNPRGPYAPPRRRRKSRPDDSDGLLNDPSGILDVGPPRRDHRHQKRDDNNNKEKKKVISTRR